MTECHSNQITPSLTETFGLVGSHILLRHFYNEGLSKVSVLFAEMKKAEVKAASIFVCEFVSQSRLSVPESTCRTSIFYGSQSVRLYRGEYNTTVRTGSYQNIKIFHDYHGSIT